MTLTISTVVRRRRILLRAVGIKTGDTTSRLSSDTTLVGDQVSLNVNVFLRSLVQAIGVLIFVGILWWRLTLVVFISVNM